MAYNLGKKFEESFRADIQKLGYFIYRLPDQVSGYAISSRNPCDFFVYKKPFLHLIECKSVTKNTFPLSNLTQYELMKSYAKADGVYPAVVIWFIDHDMIIYVPIDKITELKESGKKSINVKNLEGIRIVRSIKKRVFLTADYSFLGEDYNVQ